MSFSWNGPSPKRPRCKVEGCPATPIVGIHPEHEGDVTYTQRVPMTPEQRDAREANGLPRELSVEYTLAPVRAKA